TTSAARGRPTRSPPPWSPASSPSSRDTGSGFPDAGAPEVVGQGVRWVVIALTMGFCLGAITDMVLEARGLRSISARIENWSRTYPIYAGALVFLFGALLAHFFLNND